MSKKFLMGFLMTVGTTAAVLFVLANVLPKAGLGGIVAKLGLTPQA